MVLVIPDFYDRFYVQGMVRLFLMIMGFRQICVQQVGQSCVQRGTCLFEATRNR